METNIQVNHTDESALMKGLIGSIKPIEKYKEAESDILNGAFIIQSMPQNEFNSKFSDRYKKTSRGGSSNKKKTSDKNSKMTSKERESHKFEIYPKNLNSNMTRYK